MINSFLKNPNDLIETFEIEDPINIDEHIKSIFNRIEGIKHSSLLGIIGNYGSGKSTVLHNVKQKRNNDEKWLHFDAWKFPERKNLWEGFILEMARQIDEETFENVRKRVDGQQNDDKKTLVNTIGSIPGLAAIKNLTHFFETSPARRVFEIQEILKNEIIKKGDRNVLIVIEDIDRSGDAGIFFLETLNHFLKNNGIEKKIIGLVPIASENFISNQNSYFKCLDFVEFFEPPKHDLSEFLNKIIIEEINENEKQLMCSFLEELFNFFPEKMTMRLLKFILRKANINYYNQINDGKNADWRQTIMFEASKYFIVKENKEGKTYFELIKERKGMWGNESIFSSLIWAIIQRANKVIRTEQGDTYNMPYHFKFFDDYNTIIDPNRAETYFYDDWENEKKTGILCSWYLNY